MSHRFESLALSVVVLGVAAWRFGATVVDRDLWGHLRFGLDKIEAGGFIPEDSYSYLTEGQTWFNHEWLSEMVMAAIYNAAGPRGLSVVKLALALGVVGVLTWWLIREGLPPLRAAVVLILGVLVVAPTFGTFRPQMFTVVLFVTLLMLIQHVERGHTRSLWWLPAMFVLWVNLHGGVLAGFAVLTTWAVLFALVETGSRRWWPLMATGFALGALAVNPNGFSHVWFLVRTTTVSRPEIQDWQPIDLGSAVGLAYLLLLVLLGAGVLWSTPNLRLPTLIPLLALTVAPLLALRHLQLFVPALVILGAVYLVSLSERLSRQSVTDTSRGPVIVFFLLALVGSLAVFRAATIESRCLAVEPAHFEFPVRAVQAMSDSIVDGNVVVNFNWGEYVIWHLGPEVQVSIDGRRETVYPAEVVEANLALEAAGAEWDRLLSLAPTEAVLLPTTSPGADLMRNEQTWETAYQDDLATVFVPRGSDLSLSGDVGIPIDGEGTCFPT